MRLHAAQQVASRQSCSRPGASPPPPLDPSQRPANAASHDPIHGLSASVRQKRQELTQCGDQHARQLSSSLRVLAVQRSSVRGKRGFSLAVSPSLSRARAASVAAVSWKGSRTSSVLTCGAGSQRQASKLGQVNESCVLRSKIINYESRRKTERVSGRRQNTSKGVRMGSCRPGSIEIAAYLSTYGSSVLGTFLRRLLPWRCRMSMHQSDPRSKCHCADLAPPIQSPLRNGAGQMSVSRRYRDGRSWCFNGRLSTCVCPRHKRTSLHVNHARNSHCPRHRIPDTHFSLLLMPLRTKTSAPPLICPCAVHPSTRCPSLCVAHGAQLPRSSNRI